MKNIIYIVYCLVKAGPENVLYDICSNINRKEYNPTIVVLRQGGGVSIEYKFQQLGIEVIHFDFNYIELELFSSRVAKQIKCILARFDKYIVHAHGFHPALIASKLNRTSICTIHNISGEDFIMSKGLFLGTYMCWEFDKILQKIDYPVAISNYMSDYYRRRIKRNIYCVYNGVGAHKFIEDNSCLRKKLNIKEDDYVIIVVGVLSKRKNTLMIIEQLKESVSDFLCLIIGDGPQKTDCIKMIQNDHRFRLEGFKENIIEYQNIADLCISAALSEGLPLSVLEAINVGVPMLMSDIPPHKEIEDSIKLESVKTFSLKHCNLLECFNKMYDRSYDRNELARRACMKFGSKSMSIEYEKIYNLAFNKKYDDKNNVYQSDVL